MRRTTTYGPAADMLILGYVWFVWPISLTVAATVTALSLYEDAGRNGAARSVQWLFAAGGVSAFAIPALATLAATDISCSEDTGFGWNIKLSGPLFLALVVAAVGGLCALRVASGPERRRWVLLASLLGLAVAGFFLETFLGVGAIAVNCEYGNPGYLWFQGGLALVLPIIIVTVKVKLFPPWS